MTLTELRYVVAVAEQRHFGRAAAACFVSQPTLSVGIRKLEDELGVRLFERNRSDVIVTPAGAAIAAQAQVVLTAADQIPALAAAAQDPLGAELRLGVIYTIGPWLVPKLITALKEKAPALSLVVRENFTEDLAAELRRGDLDIAVMSLPFDDPQIISRPLYEEPFRLAMPIDHPLAARKTVRADSLSETTVLLLGARNCFRDQVLDSCPGCVAGDDASQLQKTLEGSSLNTICQMVATGVGVTVLPATYEISAELARHITTRPFRAPRPGRTVAAFYRRGFARPELVNCLAEAVRHAGLEGVRYCR